MAIPISNPRPRSLFYKAIKSILYILVGLVLLLSGIFTIIANSKADELRQDYDALISENCERTAVLAPYNFVFFRKNRVYPTTIAEAKARIAPPYREGQPADIEQYAEDSIPDDCRPKN